MACFAVGLFRIRVWWCVLLLAVLCCPCRLCAQLSPAQVTGDAALLHDVDPTVRLAAARRLGNARELRSAEMLRTLLYDADARVRAAAADVLGSFAYKGAIPDLLTLCKDPDADVRAAAARALAIFHDQSHLEVLLPLQRDASPHVRAAAAFALGALADPRGLEPLRELLDDGSPAVRAAAARSLGELAQLPGWVPSVPRNWFAVLDNPQKCDSSVRDAVLVVFKQVGWDQTREALAKLLPDPDPAVRVAAVLSLAELRDLRGQPSWRNR